MNLFSQRQIDDKKAEIESRVKPAKRLLTDYSESEIKNLTHSEIMFLSIELSEHRLAEYDKQCGVKCVNDSEHFAILELESEAPPHIVRLYNLEKFVRFYESKKKPDHHPMQKHAVLLFLSFEDNPEIDKEIIFMMHGDRDTQMFVNKYNPIPRAERELFDYSIQVKKDFKEEQERIAARVEEIEEGSSSSSFKP